MDFSKLTTGQWVVLGSGLLLIIALLFLPWYGIGGFNIGAFDSGFLAWFGSLVAIAGAVLVAIKVFAGNDLKLGTLQTEQLALLLGGLGTIFILLRWITETSLTKFGIFIGLLSAAGVTAGSFMAMKEAGLELPDADDFRSIGGGSEGGGGGEA